MFMALTRDIQAVVKDIIDNGFGVNVCLGTGHYFRQWLGEAINLCSNLLKTGFGRRL